jgi:hypothetical protein
MLDECWGWTFAILLLPLALLQACSAFEGAPNRTFTAADDLQTIQSAMTPSVISDCLLGVQQNSPKAPDGAPGLVQLDQSGKQACRNRIVSARKYAIDLNFSQFEQQFFAENRWTGFGATVVGLGLGTAGSLTPLGTSHALSAAAAGVTGTRAAYEREILAERTLITIDTTMHGQRDLIAVNIRNGLQKSAEEYPLATGLSDLDAYYQAGTVLGALTAANQAAGTQADVAQNELRNPLPITRTPAAQFLRGLINTGTPEARASNETRIRAEMTRLGVPANTSVSRFVFTGDPTLQETIARDLGWTP